MSRLTRPTQNLYRNSLSMTMRMNEIFACRCNIISLAISCHHRIFKEQAQKVWKCSATFLPHCLQHLLCPFWESLCINLNFWVTKYRIMFSQLSAGPRGSIRVTLPHIIPIFLSYLQAWFCLPFLSDMDSQVVFWVMYIWYYKFAFFNLICISEYCMVTKLASLSSACLRYKSTWAPLLTKKHWYSLGKTGRIDGFSSGVWHLKHYTDFLDRNTKGQNLKSPNSSTGDVSTILGLMVYCQFSCVLAFRSFSLIEAP